MDDLIGEFINETSESLAALERALGEHACTPMIAEGWDRAYRLMHTIKGTCGFLQLHRMEAVAERCERLLAGLRDGALAPTEAEFSTLRRDMTQITGMMEYLETHGREPDASPPAATPEDAPPVPTQAPPAMSSAGEPIPRARPASAPPPGVLGASRAEVFGLPPLSQSPGHTALATRPEPAAAALAEERISYATLAALIQVRNQLKEIARQGDARVAAAHRALDGVVGRLRGKLLPRPKMELFPRPCKALVVESGGLRFALPQTIIGEVARIGDAQRHARLVEGAMLSLRGAWFPRMSLARRLGQEQARPEAYAIILELHGTRVALCVEEVGELEELPLQKLPRLLRGSKLYEAAAILGDGSPCLMLDAEALLAQEEKAIAAPAPRRAASAEAPLAPISRPLTEAPTPPMPAGGTAPATALAPAKPAQAAPVPFLLFSDGTARPKAIPLMEVARVEHIEAVDVKRSGAQAQVTCRGELLNLHVLPGSALPQEGDFPLIMLLDSPGEGIVAHRVGGIVDEVVALPAAPQAGHILTRASLRDAMTDIINARAYMPAQPREVQHA